MSQEQTLIDQALQDFKDEAVSQFKATAREAIKKIADKQKLLIQVKKELADLQKALKDLTIDQIEIDLKGVGA